MYFFGPFSGVFPHVINFFYYSNCLCGSMFSNMRPILSKKIFCSLKKGRIFAPAFDGRKASHRKRKDIEILGSRDSVCQTPSRRGRRVWDTNESKVKKAILTMKSLILAQDER